MSTQEFCKYLEQLATNIPIEIIENEIETLKVKEERWDWLDDDIE